MTAKEASKILGQLGAIGAVEPLDATVQKSLGIPPAMLVTYCRYDPDRRVGEVSSPLTA